MGEALEIAKVLVSPTMKSVVCGRCNLGGITPSVGSADSSLKEGAKQPPSSREGDREAVEGVRIGGRSKNRWKE